jgi:hypothetical protein
METRDLFAAGASLTWVWTLFCEVPFPELTADDGVVRGTRDVICFFLAAARPDPALPAFTPPLFGRLFFTTGPCPSLTGRAESTVSIRMEAEADAAACAGGMS